MKSGLGLILQVSFAVIFIMTMIYFAFANIESQNIEKLNNAPDFFS